jgi:hypothetical protein
MKTGEYLAYWLGTIYSETTEEKLKEHFLKHSRELKNRKNIDRSWVASMKNLLCVAEMYAERNGTTRGKITQEEQLTRLLLHHIHNPETSTAPPQSFATKSKPYKREEKELEKRLRQRGKPSYIHHNEADHRTLS